MECEICGRTIERVIPVRIEGTLMRTCQACSRFGVRETEKRRKGPPKAGGYGGKISLPKVEFVEDYPEVIKKGREGKGLTQDEMGNLINERASVISRLEAGRMVPDLKLARKLERILGVEILGEEGEERPKAPRSAKRELTLGDVVTMKEKGDQK